MLSFTDVELEPVKGKFPFITEYEMSQDVFAGMTNDWTTGRPGTSGVIGDTLDADAAEEFVRVVTEHPDPIRKANVNSRNFGAEFAFADIDVPYHEGAQSYFEDAGIQQTHVPAL